MTFSSTLNLTSLCSRHVMFELDESLFVKEQSHDDSVEALCSGMSVKCSH